MAVAVKTFQPHDGSWKIGEGCVLQSSDFLFFRKIKTCDKYDSLRSEKLDKLQPEEGKSSAEL